MKNHGLKFDNQKLQWCLLPLKLLTGVVKILTFGAKKYDRNSWQNLDNGSERYFNALIRHLTAMQDETGNINLNALDPESNHPHLWHVQTNAIFLEHFRQKAEIKQRRAER
ncbi:dATP/dGTP diphosphohydrolase domain-containing protein [Lentisphaerota bacterium WC36G]|nr:DUF5664 domain-containing protein [Lentisphaerae bacterium WC36]